MHSNGDTKVEVKQRAWTVPQLNQPLSGFLCISIFSQSSIEFNSGESGDRHILIIRNLNVLEDVCIVACRRIFSQCYIDGLLSVSVPLESGNNVRHSTSPQCGHLE